jgi:hypothetical protein
MMDVMFDMPATEDKEFRITLDYARQRIERLA